MAGREVRDAIVEPRYAEARRLLGSKARSDLEKDLGVLVALLDGAPVRRGGRGMLAGGESEKKCDWRDLHRASL